MHLEAQTQMEAKGLLPRRSVRPALRRRTRLQSGLTSEVPPGRCVNPLLDIPGNLQHSSVFGVRQVWNL